MTNKREFFFIVFLCAVSAVVFCANKRFSMPASALNAVSNTSSKNTPASAAQHGVSPVEDADISENVGEWDDVPSAENLITNSLDLISNDSAIENSAASKAEKETKETETDDCRGADFSLLSEEGAGEVCPPSLEIEEIEETEENKKIEEIKETAPVKEYTQFNSAENKKLSTASIQINNTNQIREKLEAGKTVKVQAEKGAIYEANKLKEEKSASTSADAFANTGSIENISSAGVKPVEAKIEPSQKKEEAKWVEPVIKNIGENNSSDSGEAAASQAAKSEEKNSAGGIAPNIFETEENILEVSKITAEPKKVSITDKTDMANVQVMARTSAEEAKKDSDSDGIVDEIELKIGSDSNKKDSDSDGFADGLEFSLGYNPVGAGILAKSDLALTESPQLKNKEGRDVIVDSDSDGICDREELIIGTDPFNSDSDGDGFSDREEFSKGYNPLKAASADSGEDKIELENPEESSAPIAENLDVASIVRQQDKDQDGAAKSEQLVLTGKAEPNSFVAIYVFSSPIADLVQADSAGAWLYILDKTLDFGEHTVYSAVVDSAGSIVAKSNPVKFLIEEIEAAPLNIDDNIIASVETSASVWKSPQIYIALGIGAVILGIIGMMIVKEINS